MAAKWNKNDNSQKPSLETINLYVNTPFWNRLCNHIEEIYQTEPLLEYSGCSMQPGWNVKYKNAGRSLCTLYPMDGYFIVLVVIGERERVEFELALPFFTEYIQQLYKNTKTGMGQKWLMIEVKNDDVLNDVMQCIAIRKGTKK